MPEASPERGSQEYKVTQATIHEIRNNIAVNALRLQQMEGKIGRIEDDVSLLKSDASQLKSGLNTNTEVTMKMADTLKRVDENTSGVVKGYTAFQGFTATAEWIVGKATKFGIPLGAALIWAKHYLWPPK